MRISFGGFALMILAMTVWGALMFLDDLFRTIW